MDNAQQTREQRQAEVQAQRERAYEAAKAALLAKITTIGEQLADLTITPRPDGIHVGGELRPDRTPQDSVWISFGFGASGGSYWRSCSDRPTTIVVRYEERRFGRSKTRVLTYSKLDTDKAVLAIAARVRGIVGELTRGKAEEQRREAAITAERKAEAERTLPVRNAVLGFRSDVGEDAAKRYDPKWTAYGVVTSGGRYRLELTLTEAELQRVLDTLAKGGAQ